MPYQRPQVEDVPETPVVVRAHRAYKGLAREDPAEPEVRKADPVKKEEEPEAEEEEEEEPEDPFPALLQGRCFRRL
jgi:hypothetical protein